MNLIRIKEIEVPKFRNPEGYWELQSPFTVILTPSASLERLPKEAEIKENVVKIKDGKIKQSVGAIQFTAYGKEFYWSYDHIIVIRDGDGNPVWQNKDYI